MKLMKKIHILTDKKLKAIIEENIEKSEKMHIASLQTGIINKQITLTTLQSQINPHFLYNSLECIRGYAISSNVPVIAEMAQSISNFFRYSISSKNNIVTLKEELENLNHYMKIQQIRFNNRFTFEIDCAESEEVQEALIPKLTLQPILENAIVHGFVRKIENARVRITIIATRKNINILFSDNGDGMNKETLYALNERISTYDVLQHTSKNHTGLALPNIDKRLKLIFGNEYGIHVSSVEGLGTDVEIHIPYMLEKKPRY